MTLGLLWMLAKDGIFAALAAIGFASISNPHKEAYKMCAVLAAIGHMTRCFLMTENGMLITSASFLASIVIGLLSLVAAGISKTPAECLSYPALLPMVPGMYAYRSVQSIIECLTASNEESFMHYLYLLRFNWMTCIITIIAMVVGVTLPIFIFKKFSFKVTRPWNSAR